MKFFLRAFLAPIFFCLFFALYPNFSFADTPQITSFLLNSKAENVTFNPNASGTVAIDIKANMPVKFTRVYICSESQSCTGTSGNYTKYFSQTTLSDSISKSWNGKKTDGTIAGEGTYRIVASMTPDGGTASLATGQYTINVDYSALNLSTTSLEDDTPVNNIIVSSHTAVEELTFSESDSVLTFAIGAGRERVTYVGSPVLFKANYKQIKSLGENKKFTWNFGDGYTLSGEEAYHSYKRAGEYEVVLNASAGDIHGSSRTKVTVLEPNLKMDILPDESISLENLGDYEINIGNFKLKSYYREYSFPEDTIIGAGKKIIFDKECTKLAVAGNKVEFLDPQNKELLSFEPSEENVKKEETIVLNELDKKDITNLDEANKLVQVLALVKRGNFSANLAQISEIPLKSLTNNTEVVDEPSELVSETTQEDLREELPKKTSFWQKVRSFPASVFYAIFGAFYQTN